MAIRHIVYSAYGQNRSLEIQLTIASFLGLALTGYISYNLIDVGLLHGNYKKFFAMVRKLRPKMFLTNLPIQITVIAIVLALNNVPVLNWGWSSLLSSDSSTMNVAVIGLYYWWLAPIFLLLLVIALPHLARFEEEIFREDTKGIKSALIRSLIFGLMHMIMGISLGAALALSIAGLWFTYQYKKGGVERSTSYHLAWNYALIFVVAISLPTLWVS